MSQFQFFNRLNSSERRFVVIVAFVLFIGFNWLIVWPHFSDLSNLRQRLENANGDFGRRQQVIDEAGRLKVEVANLLREGGGAVPQEDQAVQFARTIDAQRMQSGVNLVTSSGVMVNTNDPFFTEQTQNISVTCGEKQLVDFLFNLGRGNSQIRVRALSVRPDTPRQLLNASVTLVASYKRDQKRNQTAAAAPARPSTPTPKPATQPTNRPAIQPTTPATKPAGPPSGPVSRTLTNKPMLPGLTNKPTLPQPTPIKK
jgi:hypothetical protein